jgi:glycosyltransferase involved in cell wall biosynthesis
VKVSIVIPTYNRAHFLKKAIDTSLAQTVPCEVVVVDHGSEDTTPEVAASYGDKIVYIRKEKDRGVHFTWLDGVMAASGDYIHFNFDDDWLDPQFIEKCAAQMGEDVALVFSAVMISSSDEQKISNDFQNLFSTGQHSSKMLERYLLKKGTLISPGCLLIRKEDVLDWLFVGNVPAARFQYKGVGPDLLFSLGPLMKYPKFGFVNETLSYFRAHPNSITIDSRQDQKKKTEIQQAYLEAKKLYLSLKFLRKSRLQDLLFALHKFWNCNIFKKS